MPELSSSRSQAKTPNIIAHREAGLHEQRIHIYTYYSRPRSTDLSPVPTDGCTADPEVAKHVLEEAVGHVDILKDAANEDNVVGQNAGNNQHDKEED